MIHKMSREAQFITTTFRPELLARSDKYYGVTYGNKVWPRVLCRRTHPHTHTPTHTHTRTRARSAMVAQLAMQVSHIKCVTKEQALEFIEEESRKP
jgi:hypothetical protein